KSCQTALPIMYIRIVYSALGGVLPPPAARGRMLGVPSTVRNRRNAMSTATERRAANEKKDSTSGRDASGRFAPGNPGGPGNPHARKVAELRQALVNFVTAEDMKEIALILKEKAKMGNLAAIKLLFQYVLGKPLPPTDPDRLDVDEWQKLQEKARPPREMDEVMHRLPAEVVTELTKIAWPCAVERDFSAPFL